MNIVENLNLEQALELARETEAGLKEEVWRALAKAKYELHSGSAAERAVQRGELLSNLKRPLKQEAGKKLQRSPKANVIIEQADQLERDIALLEDIFRNDEGRYVGDEVPSWCTCQLTLEVFHEPAVTPSGISYEQSTLLEHIQKVGEWDPVTRQPCKAKDIRKNIGLRNAVESYLNENPWAWYHAM